MARKKTAPRKAPKAEATEAPAPKKPESRGVKAAKGFNGRILGRWARAAVLSVAEAEITGAEKKAKASDYVAGLVADAIPDTPTGTLIEAFAVPVARALFEKAIQAAYDELKAADQVR